MFKMKVNCQSRSSVAVNTKIPFVPIVGMFLYLRGFGGKFQITEVTWDTEDNIFYVEVE